MLLVYHGIAHCTRLKNNIADMVQSKLRHDSIPARNKKVVGKLIEKKPEWEDVNEKFNIPMTIVTPDGPSSLCAPAKIHAN